MSRPIIFPINREQIKSEPVGQKIVKTNKFDGICDDERRQCAAAQ